MLLMIERLFVKIKIIFTFDYLTINNNVKKAKIQIVVNFALLIYVCVYSQLSLRIVPKLKKKLILIFAIAHY